MKDTPEGWYRRRVRRGFISKTVALGGALLASGLTPGWQTMARAAAWPNQTIRLYVGYAPGGGTDIVGRAVAQALTKVLGVGVIVENRGGASSTIAATQVVQAAPDGYSLLFATEAALTGAMLTIKNLPYDPLTDLIPVSFVGNGPFILVANPKFPPNTLPELVSYCRAHPNQVATASGGTGTADYFFLAWFALLANMQVTHVSYRGAAPLLQDLIGGRIQYALDTPGTTLPLIRSGQLKAIAILSDARIPIAPEVPTAAEQGYPKLTGGSWYGILAPKGTPAPIVEKMSAATRTALATPDVRKILTDRNVQIRGTTPAQFKIFIDSEVKKWKEVAAEVGIVPQ